LSEKTEKNPENPRVFGMVQNFKEIAPKYKQSAVQLG
jgi:hypothetical protein